MIDAGIISEGVYSLLLWVLSACLLGLSTPLILRFGILNKPLAPLYALGCAALLVVVNGGLFHFIIFLFGGSGYGHLGLLLAISVVAFFVLIKKNKSS